MLDDVVQFPDLRIEYEWPDGRREIENVEVLTPHYRGAHAAAKARSGFTCYRGGGARVGRIGPQRAAADAHSIPTSPTSSSDDVGATRRRRRRPSPGVTDRQAAFLVTVMLHAGVCMDRHYCTFAGIPHGRKTHDFFRWLVDRRYATAHLCRNNSARLFHIHYKPLYAAIGEPDNRHRKPTPLPRAIERLMVLDAVLADRGRTWLATEQDKLTHFTLTHRIPRQDLPSLTFRSEDTETVRYFPDKLPIGVDREGGVHLRLCGDAARTGRLSGLPGTPRRTAADASDLDDSPPGPTPFRAR